MLLKYKNATLRAIEAKDSEILLNMMNDIEIEKMTVQSHLPLSSINQDNWIKNYQNTEKTVRLMVELENGKTIGMVILHQIDYKTRTAELAFKRYAKKEDRLPDDMLNACIAMLEYAFYEMGLNCVYCTALTYNSRSLNLQKRLGFKEEGVLRQRVFKNGAFQDLVSTSLLKTEFVEKWMGEVKKI